MSSSTRNALILALVFGGAAYLFYRADSFWGLAVSCLIILWALIYALPIMDPAWRLKVGFSTAVFFLGLLALWPSLDGMMQGTSFDKWTGGKLHCPQWLQQKGRVDFKIAPGLDLRGGARLVYTVQVDDWISDKRKTGADEMRQALSTAYGFSHQGDRLTAEQLGKLADKLKVYFPENDTIRIHFNDKADVAKIDDTFKDKFKNEYIFHVGPTDNDVTFKMRAEIETRFREDAVGRAKDTVAKRIDELGLRETGVTTRDEDIIVEVPGSDPEQFEKIKDIIKKTARLEFKMVDAAPKDRSPFAKLKEDELPKGISVFTNDKADDGLDDKGRRRYTTIYYLYAELQPNETMKECHDRLKKWVDEHVEIPDDHQVGYGPRSFWDPAAQKLTDKGWQTYYLFARADITGDQITDVGVGQDTSQGGFGQYYVQLHLNQVGADRFDEVTKVNINRDFAIILDDVIDSAPVIKSRIGGGVATITMAAGQPDAQLANAKKLELVLKSGALPAQIGLATESQIGPSLGRDAIDQGAKGMMVGSLLVFAFMVLYYRKSGLVADAAVLFNLLLQLAILASFSGTLTLPGIAGLALTIGMCVDVNVLINERIREELRQGRSVRAAIEAGYSKAFSSILDGHVTVFISGLILAQYGTGPVKGFAVMLIIGIICSLYTGVFCTRLVFDWWARGAKVKRLSVGAEF